MATDEAFDLFRLQLAAAADAVFDPTDPANAQPPPGLVNRVLRTRRARQAGRLMVVAAASFAALTTIQVLGGGDPITALPGSGTGSRAETIVGSVTDPNGGEPMANLTPALSFAPSSSATPRPTDARLVALESAWNALTSAARENVIGLVQNDSATLTVAHHGPLGATAQQIVATARAHGVTVLLVESPWSLPEQKHALQRLLQDRTLQRDYLVFQAEIAADGRGLLVWTGGPTSRAAELQLALGTTVSVTLLAQPYPQGSPMYQLPEASPPPSQG